MYTNLGLSIVEATIVRRTRLLPIPGEVLCEPGQTVEPQTVVARAIVPGFLQTISATAKLQIELEELQRCLCVTVGSSVQKGEILARRKGLFGLGDMAVESPTSGLVEFIDKQSGTISIRTPDIAVEVNAQIAGRVVHVIDSEGVVIETPAAYIQGAFGVGGEQHGCIRIVSCSPEQITEAAQGCILVVGSRVTYDALLAAVKGGARGIIAGSIDDEDLSRYLGYDVGQLMTGQEEVPITVVITEGFGELPMTPKLFSLLQSLDGKEASIDGTTQIRAGAQRPEVIIPLDAAARRATPRVPIEITIGSTVRMMRGRYAGALATVVELPLHPTQFASGWVSEAVTVSMADGSRLTVPLANVETIQR